MSSNIDSAPQLPQSHEQWPGPPVSDPRDRATRTDPRVQPLATVGDGRQFGIERETAFWIRRNQKATHLNGAGPLAKPGSRRKSLPANRKRTSFNGACCATCAVYCHKHDISTGNVLEDFALIRLSSIRSYWCPTIMPETEAMIEDYPAKFQELLKQDPYMDLDSLHDAIVELESRPPEDIKSLPGYLCGRAQRREIDKSRQRQRWRILADSDDAIEGQLSKENDPLEYLDETERRESVNDMLKLLPQDQHEILQLVYFKELQQTEIATKLNCSPQSVHTRLSRAKTNLERLLTQRWHGKEFQ